MNYIDIWENLKLYLLMKAENPEYDDELPATYAMNVLRMMNTLEVKKNLDLKNIADFEEIKRELGLMKERRCEDDTV